MSGDEIRKSAVDRLQATGTLYTTAMRSRAFTSTSWGCGSMGSQKKISTSTRPSAIMAPSCWSPPRGPERSLVTGGGGTWKRYRGGTARTIWVGDPSRADFREVTDFDGTETVRKPYENGFEFEVRHAGERIAAGQTESEVMSLDESLEIMGAMDALRADWGVKYPFE